MYLAKIWGMLSQFLFIRVKGLPSVRRQICIDTSRLGYNKQLVSKYEKIYSGNGAFCNSLPY